MEYKSERLAAEHIDGVAELERLCFADPWPRQAFLEELANPLARYTVLVTDGVPVGYIGYWHVVDEGQITNVAVHPAHRRRGLAERLLGGVIAQAQETGVRLLTLEVRVSNAAAIALYQKFGFAVAGRRKRYYGNDGEDALIMIKEW